MVPRSPDRPSELALDWTALEDGHQGPARHLAEMLCDSDNLVLCDLLLLFHVRTFLLLVTFFANLDIVLNVAAILTVPSTWMDGKKAKRARRVSTIPSDFILKRITVWKLIGFRKICLYVYSKSEKNDLLNMTQHV